LWIILIARISPISVIPSWESKTLSRRFGTLISLLHRLSHIMLRQALTLCTRAYRGSVQPPDRLTPDPTRFPRDCCFTVSALPLQEHARCHADRE
jgi:hypothetical protein